MKCQILFSGKIKKKKFKCSVLKVLPSMLSIKEQTGIYVIDLFVALEL